MTSSPTIVARTEQVIRRPAAEVFAAFVDPDVITRFWLKAASGPLAPGASVHWTFLVEGAEVDTEVTAFEAAELLAWEWSDGTSVEVRLHPFEDAPDATHVVIEHVGFHGHLDEAIAGAVDATQGFTLVLCSLKLLLETGSPGTVMADKAALITASLGGDNPQ